MNDQTTWLTPSAHAKLVAEYERLTTEGRHLIEQRIADARAHGDIRENAEYDAAKNEQGMMEARIRQLRRILDTAEVREAADNGVVDIGSLVTVVDDDGDEMEFLVAPSENKVIGILLASPDSPLGAALLGKSPGESVAYQAPGGTFTYQVKAVRPYEA
ncbi:MAG: transcription elongation factor GreA [Actinobacteria bacterium]|nr:MAG: transcription elongation factor GreA [Actinomycetota bacterium]